MELHASRPVIFNDKATTIRGTCQMVYNGWVISASTIFVTAGDAFAVWVDDADAETNEIHSFAETNEIHPFATLEECIYFIEHR